jgi:ribosomal protein L11 methyltransferase
LSGRSVLDFGCGTAILGIAAVKWGARRCQGVEIDAEAAATAERNVALNGLADRITISQGSWETVKRRVDLLLANLVPSVLLTKGSEIPAHLCENGRAVVSGFGRKQSQEVESFFSRLGLKRAELLESEGWAAFVMERR